MGFACFVLEEPRQHSTAKPKQPCMAKHGVSLEVFCTLGLIIDTKLARMSWKAGVLGIETGEHFDESF